MKSPSPRSRPLCTTPGCVDLHFHGAFGVDLMRAERSDLNALSEMLYARGVSGFCPTTLSSPASELLKAVHSLGSWIRATPKRAKRARPLGIHLEGPFINPRAAGAHPEGILRPLTLTEVTALWEASEKTLKILTIAPETLDAQTARGLAAFARKNRVRLAIGHTKCTRAQARAALETGGFSGVTHAWNAMAYHHRDLGALGEALGRKDCYAELIIDGIHVEPKLVEWTRALHPKGVVYVSDAAPAAGTDGTAFHSFGGIDCRFADGASRLENGALAGGGYLLTEMVARLAARLGESPQGHARYFHDYPLRAINAKASDLPALRLRWSRGAKKTDAFRYTSR